MAGSGSPFGPSRLSILTSAGRPAGGFLRGFRGAGLRRADVARRFAVSRFFVARRFLVRAMEVLRGSADLSIILFGLVQPFQPLGGLGVAGHAPVAARGEADGADF